MLMSDQMGVSTRACTLVALALAASSTTASAADYNLSKAAPAAASNEALLKKLEAMEERIKFLEGKLEQKEEKGNQEQEENGDQKQARDQKQPENTDQKQKPAGGKAAEAKPRGPRTQGTFQEFKPPCSTHKHRAIAYAHGAPQQRYHRADGIAGHRAEHRGLWRSLFRRHAKPRGRRAMADRR